MLYYSLFFIVLALLVAAVFSLRERHRIGRLQACLRAYNEARDLRVITDWIAQKDSETRISNCLDYLQKIEEFDLAAAVFDAFPIDQFTSRHVRIFACRAFQRTAQVDKAKPLAQRLLETYPEDDSILDLYLDIHLSSGDLDAVKERLLPRMDRKYKGTTFPKHYARLAAAEGDFDKAVSIMETVVNRDYILHRNTYAPMAKRLIYEQYQENVRLLDSFKQGVAAGGE